MKTTIYSLIAAAAACGFVGAQTVAYTIPVGDVKLGDTTSGQPAVKTNTDSSIALPLARPTEFAGTVASIAGNTLTVAGSPGFTPGRFTSVPYCLVVKSGPQAGLYATITAYTADTLTLNVITGTLSGVAATDKIVIAKCWTVGSFLPIAGIPNGTQLLAFSGIPLGVNLVPDITYTKGASNWTIGGIDATNNVLYPTESFILRTGATAVTSLVIAGEVPTWNHRTAIDKLTAPGTGQDNRLSYFSPTSETVSLASIPAATGDEILIFNNATAGINKAASQIITRQATGWTGTLGLSGNQDAFQLQGGVGYVYRRVATDAAGNLNWSDVQTYRNGL